MCNASLHLCILTFHFGKYSSSQQNELNCLEQGRVYGLWLHGLLFSMCTTAIVCYLKSNGHVYVCVKRQTPCTLVVVACAHTLARSFRESQSINSPRFINKPERRRRRRQSKTNSPPPKTTSPFFMTICHLFVFPAKRSSHRTTSSTYFYL